jgi:opacity protein-like surface antigen
MRRVNRLLTLVALAALATAAPAAAQSGFALKGGLVFNSSDVEDDGTSTDLSDAAGFHVGAEYMLPLGVAIGISGYTAGSPGDFDTSEGSLLVLADANYFFSLPLLPLKPYVGAHAGLGTLDLGDVEGTARPEVDFDDLGFQLGLRFQPTGKLGVDAQYRRVSGSLDNEQSTEFDTNQILVGVILAF